MRLTENEIQSLIDDVNPFVKQNMLIELRLYGSRLEDPLKGGDIDLLIVCASEESKNRLGIQKAAILAKIYLALDEENVDLLIINRNDFGNDIFATNAFQSSQLIFSWR